MTISELIKGLGGATVLSEGIGLPGEGVGALRVRAWAQRNAIPGGYWKAIADFAHRSGSPITLDTLAEVHAVGAAAA